MKRAIRSELSGSAPNLTLCRPDEHDTITPQLWAELASALDEAEHDDAISVPAGSRLVGTLFDGVARHTREGRELVDRATGVGSREAVRERDEPFGDHGQRR